MGAKSRRKGAAGECEAIAKLNEVYGDKTFRSCRSLQAQQGHVSGDTDGPHWFVEIKRRKRVNMRQALQQATDKRQEADDTRVPVAFTRNDREPWVAVMWMDDWLELVEDWIARGER